MRVNMFNRIWFNSTKQPKELPKEKEEFDYYYTVVLDIEKYNKWLDVRKSNNSSASTADIARKIGYTKSYLSQLLNQKKYDIEVSARFIATFLKTFGLEFREIFKLVRVKQTGMHQKERYYMSVKDFRRHDKNKLPHTFYAR
jgi:transcriptional regulator with XRE-family HTH domain